MPRGFNCAKQGRGAKPTAQQATHPTSDIRSSHSITTFRIYDIIQWGLETLLFTPRYTVWVKENEACKIFAKAESRASYNWAEEWHSDSRDSCWSGRNNELPSQEGKGHGVSLFFPNEWGSYPKKCSSDRLKYLFFSGLTSLICFYFVVVSFPQQTREESRFLRHPFRPRFHYEILVASWKFEFGCSFGGWRSQKVISSKIGSDGWARSRKRTGSGT